VKNITVAISEDAHRAARVYAAEQGTSVSGLVAAYLDSLSKGGDGEFERLEAQQRRIQGEIEAFTARERPARKDAHARAIR
jgi:hypothetical protein